MKKAFSCAVMLVACTGAFAQHSLSVSIKNKEDQAPLPGATVTIPALRRSAIADSSGLAVFSNLATGSYTLKVSFVGLQEGELTVQVPQPEPAAIGLERAEGEEDEEVVVQATRTVRPFRDIPARVEVISGEELAEKANMKPGDIRMMLSESTGIQTQQTSATSYNSSIRIQGLDGRYTQILKDGFPLYAGFSGGLSLTQVVPLDLRQVEVIKGSSSTLYGGGAIAGLVNLVSKTPSERPELSFLANGTTAGGLDLTGFYSRRHRRFGITLLGSRNSTAPYDPAGVGLTAIPKSARYTLNPRLFLYGNRTTANLGLSYIGERRTGGSVDFIKRGTAGFFEENDTRRLTTQLSVAHRLGERASLNLKSSYSRFNRTVKIPTYQFGGIQQSTYSELTLSLPGAKSGWIFGANLVTDAFREAHTSTETRNYSYTTLGAFAQNTWTPSAHFALETGLRADYVSEYGLEILPKLSAMWRITERFTARIGGGFGYKTPTIFNEESERNQFRGIRPINAGAARNERSVGNSVDVNYRTSLGGIGIVVNQLLFYTRLNRPLVLTAAGGGGLEFINAPGHIDTKGTETNLRLTHGKLKLFIGYTYADVNTHYGADKDWLPLTARHRLNNVLMYEKENRFKLGLEAYYVSPQRLGDGSTGRAYWTAGFMAEKFWKAFSLFVNFENLTDTRQTRFGPIYSGSIDNPVFTDIYAPLDGVVVNGGIKVRL